MSPSFPPGHNFPDYEYSFLSYLRMGVLRLLHAFSEADSIDLCFDSLGLVPPRFFAFLPHLSEVEFSVLKP